jgi:hypothetical protein
MKRLLQALKSVFPRRADDETADGQRNRQGHVWLAAFGKHPGWDDHMEDLGLETDPLVAAKEILYFEGIRGNIDSGKWEELSEARSAIDFCHFFTWWQGQDERDVLIGQMWASKDGKGRARYPMILCAHCRGLPLNWVMKELPPRLQELQLLCLEAQSASEVKTAVSEAQQQLRQTMEAAEDAPEDSPASSCARLVGLPEMGEKHERLHRILYLIEEEMSEYGPQARRVAHFDIESLTSPQLRVPLCAGSPPESALLWKQFVHTQLSPASALLIVVPEMGHLARKQAIEEFLGRPLIVPAEQTWADIFVGRPTLSQVYAIRASLDAIPRTTDIPYKLEEDFVRRADEVVASFGTPGEVKAIIQSSEDHITDVAVRHVTEILTREKRGAAGLRSVFRKALWVAVPIAAIVILILLLRHISVCPATEPPPRTSVPAAPAEGDFDLDAWRKLCDAYYAWFGLLRSKVSEENRLSRWSQDTHLKDKVLAVLDRADAGEIELDPREIVGAGGKAISYIRSNPPVRAKSPIAVQKTKEALAAIEGVQQALTSPEWQPRKAAAAFQERAAELGWKRAAGKPGSAIDALQAVGSLVEGVDGLLDTAAATEKVLSCLTELDKFQEKAEKSGDGRLEQAAQQVQQALSGLAETSLEDMPARLEELMASALKAAEH